NHFCSLILIFQVWRMDMNELLVAQCQVNMVDEGRYFVACHAVNSDLTNSKHIRSVQELRNHLQYLPRQFSVLAFFGIEAQPAIVLNAVFRSTTGLETG